MNRQFYLDLAASGLRMPIGADLVLQEQDDPAAVLQDGQQLGQVIIEAARRYRTPLALSLMDLAVEKETLLTMLDVPAADIPKYHFDQSPTNEMLVALESRMNDPMDSRLQARIDAIAHVARHADLVPVGMVIGPFSLMTKLIADPIVPVYLAGAGTTADEDEEVRTVERVLELAVRVVLRSVSEQLKAGAKAICLAEPAASTTYISPSQLEQGSNVFDRYVMHYNRRIRELLRKAGAELVFHCCGELTEDMVNYFGQLDPAMLSLGSSRKLWQDASAVPKRTVLYGNLPSKKFFSDKEITREQLQQQARELIRKMREAEHPFILGSECDVLSVPGCHDVIKGKVAAFMDCDCD